MFHHSFLDIMKGNDPLDTEYKIKHYTENIDFNTLPKTIDTIEEIAPIMLQKVKREQELIDSHPDYYVAIDLLTNTYYICYKNIMMIDIDTDKLPQDSEFRNEDFLLHYFNSISNYCFKIFKSANGYHVFCVSHKFYHRDKNTAKFMLNNNCDFYYCIFAYIRGFCVRLNRKFSEKNKTLYEYKGLFGNKHLIDDSINKLVDKHIDLVSKYKNTINTQ